MKIISIIPARGGSKGIPNKNIIDFHGKPLITWTIEQAMDSKMIDEVYVTSDSSQILSIAEGMGCIQFIDRVNFLMIALHLSQHYYMH